MRAGRPRIPAKSKVGQLIDAYLDEGHELKNLARDVGVSDKQIYAWRMGHDVPDEEHETRLGVVLDKRAEVARACKLDRVAKAARSSQKLRAQNALDARQGSPSDQKTNPMNDGDRTGKRTLGQNNLNPMRKKQESTHSERTPTWNYRISNVIDPELVAEGMIMEGVSPPLMLSSKIYQLNFTHKPLENLTPLAGLTSLINLDLFSTRVSDLSPLAGLISLQFLKLTRTRVRDLSPLSGLINLTHLDLEKTAVSDLSPLAGLICLEWLDLDSTEVNDLSPLSALINLQRLDLKRTEICDLTPLAHLDNLEMLDLRSTYVRNVSPLAGLTKLKRLYLTETEVTDVSVLSHLRTVRIDR